MEDIRTSARVTVHTSSTSVRSRSFIAQKSGSGRGSKSGSGGGHRTSHSLVLWLVREAGYKVNWLFTLVGPWGENTQLVSKHLKVITALSFSLERNFSSLVVAVMVSSNVSTTSFYQEELLFCHVSCHERCITHLPLLFIMRIFPHN